jgi:hypothetical protein
VKRSTNDNEAAGRPSGGDELPKQDPTAPKSVPDPHVLVPNYNLQRRRWKEEKRTWWRWGFVLRSVQRDLGSILRVLRMNSQNPNINVIRSVWRRVKKPVNVRDLKPVKDVKGGGGVTGESKPTTGEGGTTGTTGGH